MKLILIALKKFITYFGIIFVTFLIITNVTLTINILFDGFIKSLIISLLLTPFSLLDYFGQDISNLATFHKIIFLPRSFEEGFKSIRNLLKTMSNLKLIDSNSETGSFILESDFSKLNIQIKSVEENKIQLDFASSPRIFHNPDDYKNYIKDVNNVIITLNLHLKPDNYSEEGEDNYTDQEIVEEFKPQIILCHRLTKIWVIFIITMLLFSGTYYIMLKIYPDISTFAFYSIYFLYAFHIFTSEQNKIIKLIECPACKHKLISKKYSMHSCFLPRNCPACKIKLQ